MDGAWNRDCLVVYLASRKGGMRGSHHPRRHLRLSVEQLRLGPFGSLQFHVVIEGPFAEIDPGDELMMDLVFL